jgi:hypothetical protein
MKPLSIFGLEINLGDVLTWGTGVRSEHLHLGVVQEIIPPKNPSAPYYSNDSLWYLKCDVYTRGKPKVNANRCAHTVLPDFDSAIGKTVEIRSYYFSYEGPDLHPCEVLALANKKFILRSTVTGETIEQSDLFSILSRAK